MGASIETRHQADGGRDILYMKEALAEAAIAAEHGDVPVGAVVVDVSTGEILARGHNTREMLQTVVGHAEINAITETCRVLGRHRLSNCALYVTLEPCPMCAGAILQARMARVVYGAADPVAGAMGSVWALHRHPVKQSHTAVECGCLEEECRTVLQSFFKNKRETLNGK